LLWSFLFDDDFSSQDLIEIGKWACFCFMYTLGMWISPSSSCSA
jgi:hypothetical protein